MDTLAITKSLFSTDDLIAWGTLLLAVFTLLLAFVGIMELKHLTHSQRLATLSQYLSRYNSIVSRIPLCYLEKDFQWDKLSAEQKTDLLQVMFDYWNLIAEEFMFHRRGWIDSEIWKGWNKGITYHLDNHPLFLESFRILSGSMRYNRMLREFIDPYLAKVKQQ